jgi:tetratricopeptide (TPR) repeat protein
MSTLWRVAFAALLLVGLDAAAQEPVAATAERARAFSVAGVAAFRQQRYDDAIAAFTASYTLAPLAVLSFDIAQAYRLKGDCIHAVELYRRYLREAPNAPNRAFVEEQLGALEPCVIAAVTPPQPIAVPRAVAPPPVPAPTPTFIATPPPPKLLVKRPWFWIAIGSAAALVATGVSLGVVYGTQTRYPAAPLNVPGN